MAKISWVQHLNIEPVQKVKSKRFYFLSNTAKKLYNRTPKRLIKTNIKKHFGSLNEVLDIDTHYANNTVLLACEPMVTDFFRIN